MRRFTGHSQPWGSFVDVKINAVDLLRREVRRKRPGRVWVSGVCDPYQPLEEAYQLTRGCLFVLVRYGWPVTVQTKSPLVLRDIDLLTQSDLAEVIVTIPTADPDISRLFEPNAPSVEERLRTIERLHRAGVRTTVMMAPLLPGAIELVPQIEGVADHVLIDRYNYHYADRVYRANGLGWAMTDRFFEDQKDALSRLLEASGISYEFLF